MKVKCPNCVEWVKSEHLPGFGVCKRLAEKYKTFNMGMKMTHRNDWCGEGEPNGTVASKRA